MSCYNKIIIGFIIVVIISSLAFYGSTSSIIEGLSSPTCAQAKYNCVSSYHYTNTPKGDPGWSKQTCAGSTCTDSDCCVQSKTNKLPLVQTYP